MAERPTTLAEMFDATVSRCGDRPALGVIDAGALHWLTWQELAHRVTQAADQESTRSGDATPIVTHPASNSVDWIVRDLARSRIEAVSAPADLPRVDTPLPSGTATLVPTSGTSGVPRWVALTEENLIANTLAVAQTIIASLGDEDDGNEIRLAFLPFHHLYARVCDLYGWIYRGSRMVLAESRETIFRDCQIVQPTTINGVPYFFQKAYDVAGRQGVSLRKLFGCRIKRCYSGGAALSEALQHAYADQGIPLLNGYGLSEASPVVTVSTIAANKPGTVGKPLPGVDLRIANDGEILVRGPSVMLGYWNDAEATADTLRGGWLHTGDLGAIDADGFLTILGRKKELLTLSTGKNVAPSHVEALLAASPWIEQVAVVGAGRSCLGALIVPNPDRVRAEVRRRRLWVWSKRRALAHPAIRAIFADEIATRLAGAPADQQVRSFQLIGRAFSAEQGEITAKLSLRRAQIDKSFASEIESIYSQRTKTTAHRASLTSTR